MDLNNIKYKLHLVKMEEVARFLVNRELIKEIIIPNLLMNNKYQLKNQGWLANDDIKCWKNNILYVNIIYL